MRNIILYSGCVVVLGGSHMFRYNDPQEAARLRKEGNKTHLNLSRLSFLSRSATDLIRSCDNISGLVTLSCRYSQRWALNLFVCATYTTTTLVYPSISYSNQILYWHVYMALQNQKFSLQLFQISTTILLPKLTFNFFLIHPVKFICNPLHYFSFSANNTVLSTNMCCTTDFSVTFT